MTPALQAYADRGVFRGFSATAATRGRIEYEFLWLTGKRMHAVFDPRRRTLAFPSLFPALPAEAAKELKAIVLSRRGRDVPAHKHIDGRRARITATTRGGALGLSVEVRGPNHAYAVTHALNVINELFVALHEHHPEYLVEQFGVSAE